MASVRLRGDFDAAGVRGLTRASGDADQARRLLAIAAVCPQRQTGAAVVMQRADTQGMQHHLDEISANVAPGAHAILVLDQAGWHTTAKLNKLGNITFLPLPPRSPELNPAENVWEYLRQRWLSNHIFKDYDAILDAVCDAWNRLTAEPDRIASLGSRPWAVTGEA